MSFMMHEIVYFGRCLPFVLMDAIPYFNKYKIQNVSVFYTPPNRAPFQRLKGPGGAGVFG